MEHLDKRIRDISTILCGLRTLDIAPDGNTISEMDRIRYEHDFVSLTVDIQRTRAENEGLIDDIRKRNTEVKKLDQAIREKREFVASVEAKMAIIDKGGKPKK
jgi:hypothetical protein